MNLPKLFELQRKLDAHIEKEHPREPGEDRLAKKILALYGELGELLKEWRGFKFWSKDQEPRFGGYCGCDDGYVDIYLGHGEVGQKLCPQCEGEGTLPNRVLEEYVDCLHFILSIGLELHADPTEIRGIYERGSVIEQFNAVFDCIARFWNRVDRGFSYEEQVEWYVWICKSFIVLGHKLGFKWEEIEQAYIEKNQENHRRQEVGY